MASLSRLHLVAFEELEQILEAEKQYHQAFFGRSFNLTQFRQTLERYGRNQLLFWQKLGLETHFLPKVTMSPDSNFPGFKKKPNAWFLEQASNGVICRFNPQGTFLSDPKPLSLEGRTVLIDTRLKPVYDFGEQMFNNDTLLGPLIERNRNEGRILTDSDGLTPLASRFYVSALEWQEVLRAALSLYLGLAIVQIRLEGVMEAVVIPQLYPSLPRRQDGNTNTSVWYEECWGGPDRRLFGGFSSWGGLSHVTEGPAEEHWDRRAFRPLIVLD